MAFDTYISIDTVDGEATQAKHEKWIEIYSFSWGASTQHRRGRHL
ncbi:MAG: type VI secretion system tube protein Hcp [Isosphaeraceae bacterium]